MHYTYGEGMGPLNLDSLELGPVERADPLVMEFIRLADATMRKEKISNPADWTAQERAAYDRGDTAGFSRLRGYTEEEIAEFLEYVQSANAIDAKYGADTAISLVFELQMQTRQGI